MFRCNLNVLGVYIFWCIFNRKKIQQKYNKIHHTQKKILRFNMTLKKNKNGNIRLFWERPDAPHSVSTSEVPPKGPPVTGATFSPFPGNQNGHLASGSARHTPSMPACSAMHAGRMVVRCGGESAVKCIDARTSDIGACFFFRHRARSWFTHCFYAEVPACAVSASSQHA
jgi:hypothetical protein